MRNAREEARDRVGGRYDVRVLEPSPPSVNEPPWFADDPLEGGDVLPVERPGAKSWAEICAAEGDRDLLLWCWDRWLVPRPALAELPAAFGATRLALHTLAEHVVAPARFQANGKVGLRFTYHGFGTPFFGESHQVRVEDDSLVVDDARHEITTLVAAAELAGVDLESRTGVYTPTTDSRARDPLAVDQFAARALGDWYGFCASVLEQVRSDATDEDAPARVQLWPEHFDLALDLGPGGARAELRRLAR